MGYISSPRHFINFIQKIISENVIDKKNLLEPETYIDFIYNKGLQDRYTWDLKTRPELLENDNLMEWLQWETSIGNFYISSQLENIITPEFSCILQNLNNVHGVYSFWTKTNIPLYIGVSQNLQERISSSFWERFSKYKKPVYFKYISAETASDAAVLEVYFICKLKPSLNGTSKYSDSLTIKIENIPNFSKPVLCNRITSKKVI